MTAIRKNRKENGNRADLLGSNPHSNGDDFSRSEKVFFDRISDNIIMMIDRERVNMVIINVIEIIYFDVQTFWLEVKCTIILNKYLPHQ